jgi:hypothetical protein
MIVVIQCAASKRADAGHLVTASGTPVDFVADPRAAPPDPRKVYARPDDSPDGGRSWRDILLAYNDDPRDNPLRLLPAYRIYENRMYGRLVDRLGPGNVYILSAGWGLIPSEFLTPYYDITFSQSADAYKRRRKTDRYRDLRMLPDNTGDDILFFGGKDYLPLFGALTDRVRGRRIVFYNSATAPQMNGCTVRRFETTTRTNWHYECAAAFLDSGIQGGYQIRPSEFATWRRVSESE